MQKIKIIHFIIFNKFKLNIICFTYLKYIEVKASFINLMKHCKNCYDQLILSHDATILSVDYQFY